MKILLTTLNSKFIHSNLAIRYLKAYSKNQDVQICEYTINDNITNIISDIYLKKADVIAFSCYIWNIEQTLKIASTLKKANSNLIIILGGPEVSFDPNEVLMDNSSIDFIIIGEGEKTFKELIGNISDINKYKYINGIAYRDNGKIMINSHRELLVNLDSIPFQYDNLIEFKGNMIYYESSRGCPFNCQYCLSSAGQGVRFFSMERVKSDLNKFIDAGVKQVKFIDRSFNCNKKRAKEILRFLIDKNPYINFHFEINADLIDEETLEILKGAREGLFQFEIGVQTTNLETCNAIKRDTDFEKLCFVVNVINSYKNIHLHLDLIAGLPYEDYKQFSKSFNDVYNLEPQMLQLGFLKLLKGSGLRSLADNYNIKYSNYASYEVISTESLTFDELIKLKDIEDILDKYYNSNRFLKTIKYLIKELSCSPFSFYEEFAQYWRENNLFNHSHSLKKLYSILKEYINNSFNEHSFEVNELLKFDYLCNHNNYTLPENITRKDIEINGQIFEFLKSKQNIELFLPQYLELTPKQIVKKIHIEVFEYNIFLEKREKIIILFDYELDSKVFKKANIFNISKYFSI